VSVVIIPDFGVRAATPSQRVARPAMSTSPSVNALIAARRAAMEGSATALDWVCMPFHGTKGDVTPGGETPTLTVARTRP